MREVPLIDDTVPESSDPVPSPHPWATRLVSWQFIRYLLVGGWNTAFGFATYSLLTWLLTKRIAHGYIYAAVLSNIINISVAFLGYKWFVFKTKGNYLREWMRCFVVYGVAALPGLFLLPILVNALVYSTHLGTKAPYVAGALLTATTVVYSFFGHKKFSFRTSATTAPTTPTESTVTDTSPPRQTST